MMRSRGTISLRPEFSYIFVPHARHFSAASGFSAPQLGQVFKKVVGGGPPTRWVGVGGTLVGEVAMALGLTGRKARTRLAPPNTRNTNPSCEWEELWVWLALSRLTV